MALLGGLQKARARFGRPETFNSGQRSPFTAKDFTDVMLAVDVTISMYGWGRCTDHGAVGVIKDAAGQNE